MKYRRDVDGLRTIAVGSVILFHFDVPYFSGGYVGVDVFFVISGFLISTILFTSLEGDRFSIVEFYERRARRILPALFLVLTATMLASAILLIPQDIQEIGESVLATLMFLANIHFWQQSGYFDGAAEFQPLLHMWSLSVEEQFYIFFPVVLWITYRTRRWIFATLFWSVFAASLALSIYAAVHYPTAAFYLPVTRAWELLLGAVIARPNILLPGLERLNRPRVAVAASLVGLGAILLPVFLLVPESVFPGVNSIPPVMGTALLIWSGSRHETPVSRMLGLPPFVGIGLISYSLYLWHWPVWVLAGEIDPVLHESNFAVTCLILLSCSLAWVSWRFVEAPFRSRSQMPRRTIFAFSGAGGVVMAACGAILLFLPSVVSMNKLSSEQANIVAYERYRDGQGFPRSDCFLPASSNGPIQGNCQTVAAPGDILIWGDSFAEHLMPGMIETYDGGQIFQVTTGGCPPFLYKNPEAGRASCRSFSNRAQKAIAGLAPTQVVISARWPFYTSGRWGIDLDEELRHSIDFLKGAGVEKIYLIGVLPTWGRSFPRTVVKFSDGNTLPQTVPLSAALYPGALDEALQRLAAEVGAEFVSLIDSRCPEMNCGVLAINGEPVQWDYGHLSIGGSIDLIASAVRPHWAAPR